LICLVRFFILGSWETNIISVFALEGITFAALLVSWLFILLRFNLSTDMYVEFVE